MYSQLDGSDKCQICKTSIFESAHPLAGRDAFQIMCVRCGRYEVSGSARVTLGGDHSALLPYLSAHTRQAWEFEGRIVRINSNWPDLAESHRHTSVHQKAEKLLRFIAKKTTQPGDMVTLEVGRDFPLVDAENGAPISYFVNYWAQLGCLEIPPTNRNRAALTVKGWDRLDPGGAGAGIPGRVFIAMSFDPSLEEAYEQGIKKAVEEDCKMTSIRVDKVGACDKEGYSQKICDRILAEIRRCQFAVADFTTHNRGAYFEAGFALGLGRLVIWTCQEDEIKTAHFDTRQYPHIVWRDAADLRRQLAERIQALMRV